jgi:hypothetical protein
VQKRRWLRMCEAWIRRGGAEARSTRGVLCTSTSTAVPHPTLPCELSGADALVRRPTPPSAFRHRPDMCELGIRPEVLRASPRLRASASKPVPPPTPPCELSGADALVRRPTPPSAFRHQPEMCELGIRPEVLRASPRLRASASNPVPPPHTHA